MVNCAQIERMLDALMDGTLSEADRAELDAHCADCPACAGKLRATLALIRMLSEMAPEADVPLKTQAAWRGAVAAEAGRARRRRLTRWASGIAAALLVALGGFFALRPASMNAAPKQASDMALGAAMEQSVAVVEADGQAAAKSADRGAIAVEQADYEHFDEAVSMEAEEEAPLMTAMPMAAAMPVSNAMPVYERRMTVEDLDRTCAYMADLVSEYEGSISEQRYEADGAACACLTIDLPGENAADFLNAAAHYDADGVEPEPLEAGVGRVSLKLELKQAA